MTRCSWRCAALELVHVLLGTVRRAVFVLTLCSTVVRLGFAQSPPTLVAAPLPTKAVTHRLVPIGYATRDTTAWRVEFHPTASPGQMLQVMVATSGRRTTVDSLMFDEQSLVPIWEHTAGVLPGSIVFERGHIRGEVQAATGGVHAIDTVSSGVVYSTTMDDIVTSRLPFAVGHQSTLRFWAGDRIEVDTARVISYVAGDRASAVPYWVVELHEPDAVETMSIEARSRRVIRHVYVRRADGARSEVVDSS
ncbi:MAG: hypothetical protein ACREND_13580 [Gemmatimonadaceae bacterium]